MEAQETCTRFEAVSGAEPSAFTAHNRAVGPDIAPELALIWQKLLDIESVGLDQNYFDLGGDSSLAVQMFAQIEKKFKVKLPLACLYDAPTIEELARLIEGEVSASGWSPLVAIQPKGSRPPLFCMHGAGGNVLNYRELSQRLGADQPFYGLQSVGLDGSCPPLTTIEDMASCYVKEIRKVQPHGPYFLAGYCMGGTVAYEVAQQLAADSQPVALLALFDTMNWHMVPLNAWTKGSHALQQWTFHIASFFSLDTSGKLEFLREKMNILRSRIPVWRGMLLSRFGNQIRVPSQDLVLAQIWKANDRASWKYAPKPFPGCVIDFRPKKQYRVFNKPELKWDKLAQGGQETIVLPVYPAAMLVEPFVRHLAVALRKAMDDAIPSSELAANK